MKNKIFYLVLGALIVISFAFISTGGGFLVDDDTASQVYMDYDRHAVNTGHAFQMCLTDSLGSGDTLKIALAVPDTTRRPHIKMRFFANDTMRLEIFESATITGGSTETAFNNDANSPATSVLTVKSGVTINSAGTQLEYNGDFASISGEIEFDYTLMVNDTTLFLFISDADNNLVTVPFTWTEAISRLR
jgi:hypothetical protein